MQKEKVTQIDSPKFGAESHGGEFYGIPIR